MVSVGNAVGYKHDPPLYGTMTVIEVKGNLVWCEFPVDPYRTKVEVFVQDELAMAYSLFINSREPSLQDKVTVPDAMPEDPHAAA